MGLRELTRRVSSPSAPAAALRSSVIARSRPNRSRRTAAGPGGAAPGRRPARARRRNEAVRVAHMSADIEGQVAGLHERRVKGIHAAMARPVPMIDQDGTQECEPGADECPWCGPGSAMTAATGAVAEPFRSSISRMGSCSSGSAQIPFRDGRSPKAGPGCPDRKRNGGRIAERERQREQERGRRDRTEHADHGQSEPGLGPEASKRRPPVEAAGVTRLPAPGDGVLRKSRPAMKAVMQSVVAAPTRNEKTDSSGCAEKEAHRSAVSCPRVRVDEDVDETGQLGRQVHRHEGRVESRGRRGRKAVRGRHGLMGDKRQEGDDERPGRGAQETSGWPRRAESGSGRQEALFGEQVDVLQVALAPAHVAPDEVDDGRWVLFQQLPTSSGQTRTS